MDNRGFNLTSHRIWLVLASLFITANLLTACAPSVPSLPLGESFTDPSGESPPVHLLIDITPSGFSNGIPVFRTFVVALDPQTGHTIWHYQLGSGASSEFVPGSALQPVVAGDLAIVEYASSHNDEAHGVLEALDLRSGQLRWRHEAGTQPGELVIAGSVIYFIPMTNPQLRVVTSPSHVVEALDRQSGRLLWSHPVDGQPESFGVSGDKVFDITSPWPCGGRVSCWHLYVLNASDGSTRWGYALDAVFTNLGIGGPLSIMFDSNNSGRIATDSGNQLV